MLILRNILMMFLLTLSSFGHVICVDSIGAPCVCPALIKAFPAIQLETCCKGSCHEQEGNSGCLIQRSSPHHSESAPCEDESEECRGNLVGMQCELLPTFSLPKTPRPLNLPCYFSAHLAHRGLFSPMDRVYGFTWASCGIFSRPPLLSEQSYMGSISSTVMRL